MIMKTRRDVYQGIADPTRREIINLLARQSLNLNAVASNFRMSRPAVSKHVRILTECGLVIIKKSGREKFCEANVKSLRQVSDWIDQYRVFWTSKLDALENYLNTSSQEPPKLQSPKKMKKK
jgi:DNA-binding transcriptional ArsR family regulator